jgi:hypothetical protein
MDLLGYVELTDVISAALEFGPSCRVAAYRLLAEAMPTRSAVSALIVESGLIHRFRAELEDGNYTQRKAVMRVVGRLADAGGDWDAQFVRAMIDVMDADREHLDLAVIVAVLAMARRDGGVIKVLDREFMGTIERLADEAVSPELRLKAHLLLTHITGSELH